MMGFIDVLIFITMSCQVVGWREHHHWHKGGCLKPSVERGPFFHLLSTYFDPPGRKQSASYSDSSTICKLAPFNETHTFSRSLVVIRIISIWFLACSYSCLCSKGSLWKVTRYSLITNRMSASTSSLKIPSLPKNYRTTKFTHALCSSSVG